MPPRDITGRWDNVTADPPPWNKQLKRHLAFLQPWVILLVALMPHNPKPGCEWRQQVCTISSQARALLHLIGPPQVRERGNSRTAYFCCSYFSISISSEDNSRIPRSSTAPRNNTQLISIKPLQHGLLTTGPKAFLTSLCSLPTFHRAPQLRGTVTEIKSDEKWNNSLLWSHPACDPSSSSFNWDNKSSPH